MSTFVVVDDHDIDQIDYTATTNLWESQLQNDTLAYGGTVTYGLTGAKASFAYNGSTIQVSGIVGNVSNTAPPIVSFTLDGKDVGTQTVPGDGALHVQALFYLTKVEDGKHELEIEVVRGTDQFPFVFDSIVYMPSPGSTPSGATTTSQPSQTGTISDAAHSGSSGPPVGAIVGGVIGGLVILAGAAVAVWFFFFRRKNRKPYFYATEEAGDIFGPEAKAVPYQAPSPPPSTVPGPQSTYSGYSHAPSGLGGRSAYTTSDTPLIELGGASGSGSSAAGHTMLSLAEGSQRVTTSPNQPARSKAAEAGMLSVPPPQATFHADSGVRFDTHGQPVASGSGASTSASAGAGGVLQDVPPSYSED